jgi:DNA/RNA endonuclease YhcR with UshA esterase domain
MQSLPPTNIVTTTPLQPNVLRADDISTLQAHLGDKVTVQGRVQDVSLIPSGNAANVRFIGSDSPLVVVWVPWGTYSKLTAALGENLGAALNGRTIRATGRLTKYKESLEVTLDDPAKLLVVATVAQSK